jgi:hypothetical protein
VPVKYGFYMKNYTVQEPDHAFSKILGSKTDENSGLGYNIKMNFVMHTGDIVLHLGGCNGIDKRLRQGMHGTDASQKTSNWATEEIHDI